jgi:hypothetical protein
MSLAAATSMNKAIIHAFEVVTSSLVKMVTISLDNGRFGPTQQPTM